MMPHHGLAVEKPHVFKSRTELAIDKYVGKENSTLADLNAVLVAGQIEEGILKMLGYVHAGTGMLQGALEDEEHDSKKLGENMVSAGDIKPHDLCHAHAIVSGAHPRAATLRAILAKFKIRIDDPDNGCWLPENTSAKTQMSGQMAKAVPHSRIHRNNYYFWMDSYIKRSATESDTYCRFQLSMVENALKNMSFPPYVMLPAGQEF